MQDSLNGSRGKAFTFTKNSKVLMTLFPFLSLEHELYSIALGYSEVIWTGMSLKVLLKTKRQM